MLRFLIIQDARSFNHSVHTTFLKRQYMTEEI